MQKHDVYTLDTLRVGNQQNMSSPVRKAAPRGGTTHCGSTHSKFLASLASHVGCMQSTDEAAQFLTALRAELYPQEAAAASAAAAAKRKLSAAGCCCCWWQHASAADADRPGYHEATTIAPDATAAEAAAAVTTGPAAVGSWSLQHLLKKLSKQKGDVSACDSLILAALSKALPQPVHSRDLPVLLDVSTRVLQQLQQQQQQQQQQHEQQVNDKNNSVCCNGCCCCRLRQLLGITSAAAGFTGSPSRPCVEHAIRLAAKAAAALLAAAGAADSSGSPTCCCGRSGRRNGLKATAAKLCRFALLQLVCAACFRVLSRLLALLPDSAQRHVMSLICAEQKQQKANQQQQEQRQDNKTQQQPSSLELLFSVLGLVGLLKRGIWGDLSEQIQYKEGSSLFALQHQENNSSISSTSSLGCLHKEGRLLLRRVLGPGLIASLAAELQKLQQQHSEALDSMASAAEAKELSRLQQLQTLRVSKPSLKDQQQQQQQQHKWPLLLQTDKKGEVAAHRVLFAAVAALGQRQRQAFLFVGYHQITSLSELLPGLGLLDSLPQLSAMLIEGICAANAESAAGEITAAGATATTAAEAAVEAAAHDGEAEANHVAALDGFLLLLQALEPLLDLPVSAFPQAVNGNMQQHQQQRSSKCDSIQQQLQLQDQQFLCIEGIRWGAVVSAWHRVCGSSLLSPRLLAQRRHQVSLAAFSCRCIAALHAVLQQLYASLCPSAADNIAEPDLFQCLYTAETSLSPLAMQTICLLLRTLWGGAALQLQLMPRGFEGLLHHVFRLQELQHMLLHAAANENPQKKLAACVAACLPLDADVMQRSGSAEFFQLLGRTYTRMNDAPALLAAVGAHLGVAALDKRTLTTRATSGVAVSGNKLAQDMQLKLGALASPIGSPRRSLAFGLRSAFVKVISSAASAALASQVPVLLRHLLQLLLQSASALLRAMQQQQEQGLALLVSNIVAVQLMTGAFFRGVQQQPQQQQELLLLHLLEAVPEALGVVADLQPVQQQILQLTPAAAQGKGAAAVAAAQQQHHLELLLHLLRRGQNTLQLSICMLLRHVRSFAAPFAVAKQLLPTPNQPTDLPPRADAAALAASIGSVTQVTRKLQHMQQQRRLRDPSDSADSPNAQQQALLQLHHQQQQCQLQQSHALQSLEYLLLLGLLQDDSKGKQDKQQEKSRKRKEQQQPPLEDNCKEESASEGYKAAVLLMLLQQEMGPQTRGEIASRHVLLQLHKVCRCSVADRGAAAQANWLLPHLPLLYHWLPLMSATATKAGDGPLLCNACGETLASCILSFVAVLCLDNPLLAAHAAAAAAAATAATAADTAAAAAAAAKAKDVVGRWVLPPDLLEERASYPKLLQRIAALINTASNAAAHAAADTSAVTAEAPPGKKRRTRAGSEQAEKSRSSGPAAAARIGRIAGLVSLQHVALGLCMHIPAEVFACSAAEDSSVVAKALWQALQEAAQRPSVHPEHQQLLLAATAAITSALRHMCHEASEIAGRWVASCIPKGRELCAALPPLNQYETHETNTNNNNHRNTRNKSNSRTSRNAGNVAAVTAIAEDLAEVLWAASAAEAAVDGKGATAAVAAVAELLLVGPDQQQDEGQELRRKLFEKEVKQALQQKDAFELISCCSAAAKEFASRVAHAINSSEEFEDATLLMLPLAVFKAIHALASSWIRPFLLQPETLQPSQKDQQQQRQEQELLAELTEALPKGCTRTLMVVVAAAVSAAFDAQLTTASLLKVLAAADNALTGHSSALAHISACSIDLLRHHQTLGAWILERHIEGTLEARINEPEAKDGATESNQQQQQQQRLQTKMHRRKMDKVSGIVMSRCAARTPEACPLLHSACPEPRPQQLLRLLRRLQSVVLSGDNTEETADAAVAAREVDLPLRGSCMRLLFFLCSHWSGAMRQYSKAQEQQTHQQREEQHDEQQQQTAAGQELCKSLTETLTGLLLQATKRELKQHVAAAISGAAAAASGIALQQPQQHQSQQQLQQGKIIAYQGQHFEAFQHLLTVVLQQEQQKDSLDPAAAYFAVETCWGALTIGTPAVLLTHAVSHLACTLSATLKRLQQQIHQAEKDDEARLLEDNVVTAAACAQALWDIALHRSELTRCLRRERGTGPLQQTLLAASQLLAQLLQAANVRSQWIWDRNKNQYQHSHSKQQTSQQQELQKTLVRVACMRAWCCSRAAQFLGELFRCCALVASSETAGRTHRKSQGAVKRHPLEAVADSMMDFSRCLIEQEENVDAGKTPECTQQQTQQQQEGPLSCLAGRSALRSSSVLLTTVWRSHEFSALQRQQQALLTLMLRLLRLLPRLQSKLFRENGLKSTYWRVALVLNRMADDAMDVLRRTGACMANRRSSSKRLLLFFAAEVAHLRQQQFQGVPTGAAQEGSTLAPGERQELSASLLSLVFEEMTAAAAADEGGDAVGEVSCHLREPARSALLNAFDDFCQHHLYKGNA